MRNNIDLFKQYSTNPSIPLRNKLVENNMGLVRHVINKSWRDRKDVEDLTQVGYFELIKSVENFDITLGYKFSSYAIVRIKGGILHYLRDKDATIRIPRKYAELTSKGSKFFSLTDDEIAKELKVSVCEWREAKRATIKPRRLDAQLYDDSGHTLIDTICGDYDPYEEALEQERKEIAVNMLSSLGASERIAMELIYFGQMTQKAAAERMGVSEVSVCRYKRQALNKLRAAA